MRELKTDMAVVDPEYDEDEDRWKPQKERIRDAKAQWKVRNEQRK